MAKFLLCRNCGKAGVHAWCKEVFSAEQRIENENKVRIQVEEYELLKKEKKSELKRAPDYPQMGPLPPPLCKNCAEFGHETVNCVVERSAMLSELYNIRIIERDTLMKERRLDYQRRVSESAYNKPEPT